MDEAPVVRAEHLPLPKSMGHLHTLAHDTGDPARLRAVLLELAEKVGRRLRLAGASGRTVTLTLRARDFTPPHGLPTSTSRGAGFTTWSRARTLDRFLDDGEDLYSVGCRILAATPLAQPIRMLGIAVSELSYAERQAWWLPEVARHERLVRACDRITDRFGDAALVRATRLWQRQSRGHFYVFPHRSGWKK